MAGFALKIKSKSGQQVLNTLKLDSTVQELKTILSSISSIPLSRLTVLSGFPPKALDLQTDSATLGNVGIHSGDTLIIEESAIEQRLSAENSGTQDVTIGNPASRGILMKHVVAADNSCLFTSIFYVLNGKVDEKGTAAPWMRELISETVKNDQENFSEAILGKLNDEYCKWILDDKSWGGAIEISILSNYYGMEIVVVDTMNAIINRFGEDKNYGQRVFLMFDGIHYDPLFLESYDGSEIQTIFPSEDAAILVDAEQLAKEANSSRQFTDVNKFTLKCLVCDVKLKGVKEAQQHGEETGHANFGEV